jgi:hypothetical protein
MGRTPSVCRDMERRAMIAAPSLADRSAGRSRFTLYDDEEIATRPAQEWIIKDVLPANALVLMFGKTGSCKTFLCLDLSFRVQLGFDYHGHPVHRGDVLYVCAEGGTGLLPRIQAWKREAGYQTRIGVVFLPQRIAVNEPVDVDGLLEAIEAKIGAERLAALRLIVVDTLDRNNSGDENSTNDSARFIRGCDTLRERTGASVIVVHHTGRSAQERSRGAYNLDCAADAILRVTRHHGRVTLECQKQRNAEEFPPMSFEVIVVGGSLAVRSSGAVTERLTPQEGQALRVLHVCSTDEGLRNSAWQKGSGIDAESSFNKALDGLRRKGCVESVKSRWKITDAGRAICDSTDSTSTPLPGRGASSNPLHQTEGVCNTPPVELDRAPSGVPA